MTPTDEAESDELPWASLCPTSSSRQVLEELSRHGEHRLRPALVRTAERVQDIVPDCCGLSLTMDEADLTFTLVAGPHGQAAGQPEGQSTVIEPALLSTLSFPVRSVGRLIGAVDLYSRSARAFAGHEVELASLFGAGFDDAVHDADLTFRSRDVAAAGPGHLADDSLVARATGVLMVEQGLTERAAASTLVGDALRAEVSLSAQARRVVGPFASS